MPIQTVEEAKEAVVSLNRQVTSQKEKNQILILECYVDGACFVFCDYQEQIQREIDRIQKGEGLLLEYHPTVTELIYFFAEMSRKER